MIKIVITVKFINFLVEFIIFIKLKYKSIWTIVCFNIRIVIIDSNLQIAIIDISFSQDYIMKIMPSFDLIDFIVNELIALNQSLVQEIIIIVWLLINSFIISSSSIMKIFIKYLKNFENSIIIIVKMIIIFKNQPFNYID